MKKLKLNKKTVTKLNDEQLNQIMGGFAVNETTRPTTCINDTTRTCKNGMTHLQ